MFRFALIQQLTEEFPSGGQVFCLIAANGIFGCTGVFRRLAGLLPQSWGGCFRFGGVRRRGVFRFALIQQLTEEFPGGGQVFCLIAADAI